MLDIKYIREHQEEIEKNNKLRNRAVDLANLLTLDDEKNGLLKKAEDLRAERNKRSKTKPSEEEIVLMRKLGDEIAGFEDLVAEKDTAVREILYQLPNLTHPSVPIAPDESGNKVVRKWGSPREFDFEPKDHLELGENLDIIDTETAGEVVGSRFAYLKGKLALLQFALLNHAFSIITDQEKISALIKKNNLSVSNKPFTAVIPPVMIRPEIMHKMGRLEPREERYHIPSDDLYLVGSAEHTLGPIQMDKTIPAADLPIRYVGYSTAFRREAGSYGKDTRGIFRVHQFDKLELESYCLPEHSLAEQDLFVAIQEELMQTLELPYQVVLKCTGDMGQPDYREYDIETWIPSQKRYRETHTSDLMTDFQSRRLNIRAKQDDGSAVHVHMNDATAYALGRTLIAIMENYQRADGGINVPKILQKYTGFESIEENISS